MNKRIKKKIAKRKNKLLITNIKKAFNDLKEKLKQDGSIIPSENSRLLNLMKVRDYGFYGAIMDIPKLKQEGDDSARFESAYSGRLFMRVQNELTIAVPDHTFKGIKE